MTLGTGRVIKQSLVAIDDLFAEGKFAKLPAFQKGIEHVRTHHSALHLIGLFGPGGVHASEHHLKELIKLIPNDITTYLHLFGDGRDLAPQSALELMKDFEDFLKDYPNIKIASFGGRYFGMDRDNNWERIQKAYDEIVFQQTQTSDTPSEYIAKAYEIGQSDEFITPVSFVQGEAIEDGDAVFYVNFRTDRARQLTQALMVSIDEKNAKLYEKRGNGCMTKPLHAVYLATMTKYYSEYSGDTFLEEKEIENTLSEVLSKHDIRQLHLAETEKFAHVTKFFNAEKEIVYDGQKNILIPSHKVATYDLDPEMSAQEIMDSFKDNVQYFDFFIINYANGDMVGHTGVRKAVVKTVEKINDIVQQMLELSKTYDVDILLTADHGNCEDMGTIDAPKTSHTTNPVPFWYIHQGEVQENIKTE
jgi:2,3-bisphosphoglycerate-independent phosphoglycerate mutase